MKVLTFDRLNTHKIILLISSFIFLIIGVRSAVNNSNDLAPPYGGAACLVRGCNPYDASQWIGEYLHRDGPPTRVPPWNREISVSPPSTLLVISPLVALTFPVASIIWAILNGIIFIIAIWMITGICSEKNRWMTTALGSIFLLTSGALLGTGNPAFFSIPLLVIGCVLLLQEKHCLLASVLWMLGLAVKPQIGGLVVLYFLICGNKRRYASIAMGGSICILMIASSILWARPQSHNWLYQLRETQSVSANPGQCNDPRPENESAIGDVHIQTVTSIFLSSSKAFNGAAYGIVAGLILLALAAAIKADLCSSNNLFLLAFIATISLLPIYHRHYDTRLLILTIPAVVALVNKQKILAGAVVAATILSIICVQCRLQEVLHERGLFETISKSKLLFLLLLRQQNLAVLLLCCLYLVSLFVAVESSKKSKCEPEMSIAMRTGKGEIS